MIALISIKYNLPNASFNRFFMYVSMSKYSELKTFILHNMVTIISIGQHWSAGGPMAGKKADLNDVQLPRPRHDPT